MVLTKGKCEENCEYIKFHPEQRICQILSNAMSSVGWKNNDLYYVENVELSAGLQYLLQKERSGNAEGRIVR